MRFWDLVHFFGGVVTTLMILWFSPILGVLMAILFIVYEFNEEWHIRDEAYKDIRAYIVGMYLTSLLYIYFNLYRVIPGG